VEPFQQRQRSRLTLGGDVCRLLLERQFAPLGLPPLTQVLLDRIKLADPCQGGFHARRVESPSFVVLSARVRPATTLDDPALRFKVDAVITVESIGLQVPTIVFQKCGRSGPLVSGRIVEHSQRVEQIANVGPETARMFLLPPRIPNFHRRVIRMYDERVEHHTHGQVVKG
jgi:hypothetical protein